MIEFLIYTLPALGWGLMPVISRRVGGKPVEQLVGTTIAAMIFALMIHFLSDITYDRTIIFSAFFSGFFWTFGQLLQFMALKKNDVSKVMPISNGTQLLFTTMASGLILREWTSLTELIVSMLALTVVMLAIHLFTKSPNGSEEGKEKKIEQSTYVYLIGSSVCLTLYVTITNYFNVSGNGIFLPQSFGMFFMAIIIYFSNKEEKEHEKVYSNILTGISWSVANIAIFYTSMRLGVGLSYTISQLCVFVSIIGGVLFLKEKKQKSELLNIAIGTVLFLGSIIVLSQFK